MKQIDSFQIENRISFLKVAMTWNILNRLYMINVIDKNYAVTQEIFWFIGIFI